MPCFSQSADACPCFRASCSCQLLSRVSRGRGPGRLCRVQKLSGSCLGRQSLFQHVFNLHGL